MGDQTAPGQVHRDELRAALDRIVLRRLKSASPAIAGLLLVLAASKPFVEATPPGAPETAIARLMAADIIAAGAFALTRVALVRWRFPTEWANPLSAGLALILVADVAMHLLVLQQPPEAEAINFVVLILGAAVFLTRPVWFAGWLATTLAAWGLIWRGGPVESALTEAQLLTEMFTASAVAVIIFVVQRRSSAQLETLRLTATAHARELERTTTDLRYANEELDAFAYTASHDLKAPLRAIDVYAEALEEDAAEHLRPREREHVARIRKEASRLAALVDGALRLSRVMRGELRSTEVDLTGMFRSTGARLGGASVGAPVEFSVADGLRVWGDPELLQAVVDNLLGNAWKYTMDEARPRVEVGEESTPEGRAFFVRDNGVGFDMARAEGLFRPFQRLETGRRFEGSGIGLATVARIIDRHGGHIWAKGAPGQGATFWFTLPSGPEPAALT